MNFNRQKAIFQMKSIKLFILLLLVSSYNLNAQFTLLESSLTNSAINNTEENAFLFSFKPDGLSKFRLENNALVTTQLPIPHNSALQEVNALNVITSEVLLIRINEFNKYTFSNNYYITIDGAKTWTKILTPDGQLPLFTYADAMSGMLYFTKTNNTGYYTYKYTSGQWDFIPYHDIPFDIISLNNGIGYLQLIANGSDRVGYTTNGGKTYQILSNIDYTKAPFSWSNNGILQKITMVTHDHWYAQYQYDSSGVKISKLMATVDKGTTWKVILNTSVDIIEPASASSVYVYKQNGSKGFLYLISDFGDKICLTGFTGRVQNMNFWDSKNGLLFALDSSTSQYGVWLVTNSGGANCYTSNSNVYAPLTAKTLGISIYPNPAASLLNINLDGSLISNTATTYSIQTLTGQVLLTGAINTVDTEINVSSLSAGVYIIKVGDGVRKFVKN